MRKSVRAACVVAVLALTMPAFAAGSNFADLFLPGVGTPTWRVHADTFDGSDLATEHFTMYTDPGGLAGAGFTHLAALDVSSAFDSGPLRGVLRSQIWRHTDSHLLFAYQLDNTGDAGFAHMRIGNIEGFDEAVGVVDVGVLHPGGTADYATGDVLQIGRATDGVAAQLSFAFEAVDLSWSPVRRYLDPGQSTSWFYVDTDQDAWHLGPGTIQNGGVSHDQIPVLVPGEDVGAGVIPEPLTALAVTAGLGALCGYIRRRRR